MVRPKTMVYPKTLEQILDDLRRCNIEVTLNWNNIFPHETPWHASCPIRGNTLYATSDNMLHVYEDTPMHAIRKLISLMPEDLYERYKSLDDSDRKFENYQ